ncbi:hypothetical protein B0H63DRAFT_469668 [Podospora didyma]|uniref:Uncharacterized protein n=1 Tax=Podospora didyma TaxID=330526 RepID=A0AAE0U1L8_9PEZI|nr:hypothetical protein B0H63DRAFT_469668 [Podospora didyma]
MAQLDKGKSKARDPPPTLFLYPSNSASASHVTLPGIISSGIGMPTSAPTAPGTSPQQQQQQQQPPQMSPPGSLLRGDAGSVVSLVGTRRGVGLNLNLPLPLARGESTRTTDRTDALWAEMQATLEEVELSATGGTRVFGPDHERKLSELRMAQISLAQAWARSEADEAIETTASNGIGETLRNLKSSGASGGAENAPEGGAAGKSVEAGGGSAAAAAANTATDGGGAKSTAGTGSARPGSSGPGGGPGRLGAKLEEETEVDILLARKRREANDRYFQRVNQGVLDVVAKLEDVATAMRAVEQESKDIWGDGDNESIPGSAKT